MESKYQKAFQEDRMIRAIETGSMFKPLSVEKREKFFKNCQLTKKESTFKWREILNARIEDDWIVFLAKSKMRLYK